MKHRFCILLALLVMSQTLAFSSQISLAKSVNNVPASKPALVAVCVESKTMVLRWAPKNRCAQLGEFKLSWSARTTPPEICVDTRTRVMMLADKQRCLTGSVKLARLTSGRRAMACVDATTGVLMRPRTGKCLVRNLAVKWMVVVNDSSDFRTSSATSTTTKAKRPTCGATCRYALMVSVDLKNQNLSWIDFSYADFRSTDLSGANLTGTNFTGANLSAVDFTNATLTGTIFTGAILSGAIFTGAAITTSTTTTTVPATTATGTTVTTTTTIATVIPGGGGGDSSPTTTVLATTTVVATTTAPSDTTAPTATASAITTSPAGAASGRAFTTQPVVRITDSGGNTVISSGVVVTATVSSGATLVGTTTATASSGIATFSNLGVSGTAGTAYTLTFTPTGLTPVTASSGSVIFGTATKAMFSTQPAGAVNGQAMTPYPVVLITDASGNTVTNSTVNVVATISSGHPATGTTTVAAINGVATFTNLVLRQDGEFTLTFTPTALTAVTSSSFTVTAFGAATKALMSTNPDGAVSGSALTTQPMVRITDASGNTVTNSTVSVVASIASGTGTLSGTTTIAAVAGVATFTNLMITGLTGSFTLTFTPTSLNPITSNSFTVTDNCATGGTCVVGSTGPGGGTVFYVGSFTASGTTCNTSCSYLEAAPSGWNTGADPGRSWATNVNSNQSTNVTGADGTSIGTGYQNSVDILNQTGNVAGSSGAVLAREYRGGSRSDWFLPSKAELNELCKYAHRQTMGDTGVLCTSGASSNPLRGGFSATWYYWSSSEYSADQAYALTLDLNFAQGYGTKVSSFYVRPVRAF